jgi:hypothetical protein
MRNPLLTVLRLVLLTALLFETGCTRKAEWRTLPQEPNQSVVSLKSCRLNDLPMGQTPVVVASAQTARWLCEVTIDSSQFRGGPPMGSMHLRMMPRGTSEEDWQRAADEYEFSFETSDGLGSIVDHEFAMTAAPGEYDVRVDTIFSSWGDPRDRKQHLLARGLITVTP